MIKVLVIVLLIVFSMEAREIAHVDLTSKPKTPEPPQTQFHTRGGGVLGHGKPLRSPDTLPLSLRITAVNSEGRGRFVVDLEITNTGDGPVSIPIGADPVPLMDPSKQDRMRFSFTVFMMKQDAARKTGVGFAESASNRSTPESKVTLQSGDSILFSLPAILAYPPSSQATSTLGAPVSVSLIVSSNEIENGIDWNSSVGDILTSENTIPLPE